MLSPLSRFSEEEEFNALTFSCFVVGTEKANPFPFLAGKANAVTSLAVSWEQRKQMLSPFLF